MLYFSKNNDFTMNYIKVFLIVASLFFGGCATKPKYIDPHGQEQIISLDQINIQDWANAAADLIDSLLDSDALKNIQEKPAVMAISRIVNNTSQQVDTDYLVKKIRIALNKSGKVMTSTTIGIGNKSEDPLAKEALEMKQFLNEDKGSSTSGLPTFTLSGKLLENRARYKRERQTTYSFQLSLTRIDNGLAVWEDEVEISKKGKRASIGW